MGQATDVATAIVRRPLTLAESNARSSEEKVLRQPEATPTGEIVERPQPAAAPVSVFQAAPSTWD